MARSAKCYKHGGGEAYEGDARLGPGVYYRLKEIIGPPTTGAHVMRVLKGETQPSFEFAVKLAAAAGVTLDELAEHIYGDEEEMAGALKEIRARRKQAA
jgi:transcriptional regulator with XRE-family HTH domain